MFDYFLALNEHKVFRVVFNVISGISMLIALPVAISEFYSWIYGSPTAISDYEKARNLFLEKKYDDALKYARKAVDGEPRLTDAIYLYSKILLQNANHHEIIKTMIENRNYLGVRERAVWGLSEAATGDWKKANELLNVSMLRDIPVEIAPYVAAAKAEASLRSTPYQDALIDVQEILQWTYQSDAYGNIKSKIPILREDRQFSYSIDVVNSSKMASARLPIGSALFRAAVANNDLRLLDKIIDISSSGFITVFSVSNRKILNDYLSIYNRYAANLLHDCNQSKVDRIRSYNKMYIDALSGMKSPSYGAEISKLYIIDNVAADNCSGGANKHNIELSDAISFLFSENTRDDGGIFKFNIDAQFFGGHIDLFGINSELRGAKQIPNISYKGGVKKGSYPASLDYSVYTSAEDRAGNVGRWASLPILSW